MRASVRRTAGRSKRHNQVRQLPLPAVAVATVSPTAVPAAVPAAAAAAQHRYAREKMLRIKLMRLCRSEPVAAGGEAAVDEMAAKMSSAQPQTTTSISPLELLNHVDIEVPVIAPRLFPRCVLPPAPSLPLPAKWLGLPHLCPSLQSGLGLPHLCPSLQISLLLSLHRSLYPCASLCLCLFRLLSPHLGRPRHTSPHCAAKACSARSSLC